MTAEVTCEEEAGAASIHVLHSEPWLLRMQPCLELFYGAYSAHIRRPPSLSSSVVATADLCIIKHTGVGAPQCRAPLASLSSYNTLILQRKVRAVGASPGSAAEIARDRFDRLFRY